jgi:hypothetical protein
MTNSGAVAVANPRGLTPPALGGSAVRTFTGETATCATYERSFTRAANRQPAVGLKTPPAMAIGFRGVITFTTHDRMVPHGWLTPAAPGGRMRIVANVRLRFARAIRFTATAGLRQPLLVHDAGPLRNSDIRGAQTHVHESSDR